MLVFCLFCSLALLLPETMANYRIDIKSNRNTSKGSNRFLKLLIMCYIIAASSYLLYKMYNMTQQLVPSRKEWAALVINLLIIIILTWQVLIISNKKFILITDRFVKYRLRFPWTSHLKWQKIKSIQLGYTSVRFITKSEK